MRQCIIIMAHTLICIFDLICPILKTWGRNREIFSFDFGSIENFKICFRDYLTFSPVAPGPAVAGVPSNAHWVQIIYEVELNKQIPKPRS